MLYAAISSYLIWVDLAYLVLAPIGLMGIYYAIYQTEYTFLALGFLTPLSINIEEYTDSFGLFLPTEPLLFGLMILLLMQHFRKHLIPTYVWRNPIVWAVGFYLFWVFITSITSTDPVASFKFLLAKLWFIIPLLLFGPVVYRRRNNIELFLYLFTVAMIIAIGYTLIVHASYGVWRKRRTLGNVAFLQRPHYLRSYCGFYYATCFWTVSF